MTRLALVLLAVGLAAAPARGAPEYLDPVIEGGMAFPVARSTWFSVINFRDDWHAPRMRFVNGRWRQVGIHEGNDIFAEPGTPVRAIAPGRIERRGWLFYSGWRLGIRGDDGRYWFYAHLRRFHRAATLGARVEAGEIIGEVGNSGYGAVGHTDEFTYHLHVGIQEPDGSWTNPYPLMRRLYRAAVERSR